MKNKILILFILFFKILELKAQTLSPYDSAVIKRSADKSTEAKLFTPFSSGSSPNFLSNVSLSSFFKEGVNGKIELQGKFNNNLSGGLSIDQKIGESDSKAIPLSLSGISPGTTVQFNLQKIFWKPHFNLLNSQIKALNEVEEAYAKRNSDSSNKIDWRTVSLRDLSLNGTEEEKKIAFATFSKASFKEPFFINAKAGFTKTSFAYSTDSVMLTQNKDAFFTPTFTLSLIKALGNGFRTTGYILLSYNYSEAYSAADDITFNMPFGTTGNYYTNTLAFGKPEKITNNTVKLEFRRHIYTKTEDGDYTDLFAFSPSAAFDINRKMLGVYLPVYFIHGSNDKGNFIDGLQGGIRFGYITSTESGKVSSFKSGFIAQLIISEPLDFLSKF